MSQAMSHIYSLDDRVSLLLIHGALHLLGHDHETPADWALMTKREDEVIEKVRIMIQQEGR